MALRSMYISYLHSTTQAMIAYNPYNFYTYIYVFEAEEMIVIVVDGAEPKRRPKCLPTSF